MFKRECFKNDAISPPDQSASLDTWEMVNCNGWWWGRLLVLSLYIASFLGFYFLFLWIVRLYCAAFVCYCLKYNWHLVISILEPFILLVLYFQLSIWDIVFSIWAENVSKSLYPMTFTGRRIYIFYRILFILEIGCEWFMVDLF